MCVLRAAAEAECVWWSVVWSGRQQVSLLVVVCVSWILMSSNSGRSAGRRYYFSDYYGQPINLAIVYTINSTMK